MVSSHKTLFFVAPLKQGEIYDPQTFKLILVAQAQAVAHFQAQRTKLGTGLVGIVATEYKHQVAIVGSGLLFKRAPYFGGVELVY